MTVVAFFSPSRPSVVRRLHDGPLGAYIDAYATRLVEQGLSQVTAQRTLRLVADLSRWLERRGLHAGELDELVLKQYRHARDRTWSFGYGDPISLRRFLEWMRDMDICVTPPPGEQTQLSCAQEDYARYLSHDIGLSARTVEHYTGIIAPFLREHIRAKGPPHWSSLKAEQVFKFFRRSAQRHSSHHLQLLRTALRSFLRYLQHRGEVQHDLTNCLPRVTRRRMAGLPKYLSAEQVRRIIGSCHRATAVGKRDYAILLILARLGLRAAEVCTLKLDDIDWQDGQMMLRGKGGEKAVMPLPRDVGKAVLEYLKHGRPRSVSRRVFLRHNAPHVGLASPGCISSIVSSAIKRADIDCPSKGAHVLRHTLATQMIRRGASLREVGHVLRHRDPNTTRIYAKVDTAALGSVASPWPEGA